MKGRKPKASAVREQLEPVRSKRTRRALDASVKLNGVVQPPRWLEGAGLEEWNRLAPTLQAAKLLTVADGNAFARYCRDLADWLKLRTEMDASGLSYETKSAHGDMLRVHPNFLIAYRLQQSMLAIEDRFGLNPVERQRIFAERARSGTTGDLFDHAQPATATPATERTRAVIAAPADEDPIGILN